MVTLPIDSATVTLLGHSVSADALLTACPRLPFANRWSDLRKGALRHLARAGAESTAIHLEPVEKAIFLACPSDPSGQFLLLDALSQADLGGAGIVLFVEPEAWTPELARGINTVSVPNRVKVSVISINDTQQSLLTLPLIAKALKCRRASFLGADVYADAGALSELAGTLTRSGEGLQVYPVHDPATGRSDRAAVALSAPVSLLDRAISALTPRLLASHYRFPDDDVQSPDTPAFQLVQRRVLTASENWIQNG